MTAATAAPVPVALTAVTVASAEPGGSSAPRNAFDGAEPVHTADTEPVADADTLSLVLTVIELGVLSYRSVNVEIGVQLPPAKFVAV
jgi:hypothetical protein